MQLPFVKMQGLGNDFIVVDVRDLEPGLLPRLAPRLCDRHFGIGADGLLLFSGAPDAPRMTIINADGSVPEMCGNGLRCFAKYLADRFDLRTEVLDITTGAGELRCELCRRPGDDRVVEVSVAMGRPTFVPEAVPVAASAPMIERELRIGGHELRITAVGTGNPHGVLFDELSRAGRLAIAPKLATLDLFPRGANIEFCRVLGRDGRGRPRLGCEVYERGCGWTLACGTGATAAVAAALETSRVSSRDAAAGVRVQLPGGWLTVAIDPRGAARMTGPAAEVFAGRLELPPRR